MGWSVSLARSAPHAGPITTRKRVTLAASIMPFPWREPSLAITEALGGRAKGQAVPSLEGGARRKGNALQSTNLDTKADANCQYGRHLEAEPMTQVVVLQRATDEQEFWHRLCFLIETKGPPEVPAAKGRLTPGAVRGGWPVWNDGLLRGGVPPIQHNTAGRRESHDVRTGTPPTPRPAVA